MCFNRIQRVWLSFKFVLNREPAGTLFGGVGGEVNRSNLQTELGNKSNLSYL